MNKKWVLVVGLYIILCLILPIGATLERYNDKVYTADQAKEWLWRARATNDLQDMAKYLNNSLKLLNDYKGNPRWIFPAPDTNYDLIKENIDECMNNCILWQNMTGDNMAYQQAVHNLQETISEIAEHLNGANTWLLCTPLLSFCLISMLWTWIIPFTIYLKHLEY